MFAHNNNLIIDHAYIYAHAYLRPQLNLNNHAMIPYKSSYETQRLCPVKPDICKNFVTLFMP